MRRRTRAYERLPLTGGLLNHDTRGRLDPKPLAVSDEAPMSLKQEHDYQVAVFDFLRLNEPRQPTKTRLVKKRGGGQELVIEPDLGTPAYEAYMREPLYPLTRVRAFPNGGHRHHAVAGKLRAEGVRKGALDLTLDAPRHGYHGARIEMKAGNGDLKLEQREELLWLRSEGYFAHVCWTDAETIAMLLWYLSIPFKGLRGLPHRQLISQQKKGGHDKRCPDCTYKIKGWW